MYEYDIGLENLDPIKLIIDIIINLHTYKIKKKLLLYKPKVLSLYFREKKNILLGK